MSRVLVLLLPLFLGCAADDVVCAEVEDTGAGAGDTAACVPTLPELALSETELDFGTLGEGESAVRTVDLRNDGTYPLGITSVSIGDEYIPDYTVAYDVDTVACASVPPADDGFEFVLLPGCALPLTVTFAPTTPGDVQNALVVRSYVVQNDAVAQGDAFHETALVWLVGALDVAPDPELESDPYVVGNHIWMERTAMYEGETIRMEVRTVSTYAPLVYSWTTDEEDAPFDDPAAAVVYFTAPEIEEVGGGRNVNIYAIVMDALGSQDWAFGRVAVYDSAALLDGECPEDVPAPTGGCGASTNDTSATRSATGCANDPCDDDTGCGGGSAALFALGALGASRRRRGA
jgi:hypothetical protein